MRPGRESPTIDRWDTARRAPPAAPVRVHVELRLVEHGASGRLRLLRLLQMGRLPHRQRQRPRRGRLARPRLLRPRARLHPRASSTTCPTPTPRTGACPARCSRRRQALVDAYGVRQLAVLRHRAGHAAPRRRRAHALPAEPRRHGGAVRQLDDAIRLCESDHAGKAARARRGPRRRDPHRPGGSSPRSSRCSSRFPATALLAMMRELVAQGGRVVWSGPPPVRTWEGGDARGPWQDLMGADFAPRIDGGLVVPGKTVVVRGRAGKRPAAGRAHAFSRGPRTRSCRGRRAPWRRGS